MKADWHDISCNIFVEHKLPQTQHRRLESKIKFPRRRASSSRAALILRSLQFDCSVLLLSKGEPVCLHINLASFLTSFLLAYCHCYNCSYTQVVLLWTQYNIRWLLLGTGSKSQEIFLHVHQHKSENRIVDDEWIYRYSYICKYYLIV